LKKQLNQSTKFLQNANACNRPIVTFILLIFIFINGCKKEILIPSEKSKKEFENVKSDIISYKDFLGAIDLKSLGSLSVKLSNPNPSAKLLSISENNVQGNLSIYTDSIQKITSDEGTSFIFRMKLSSKRATAFRNLTIYTKNDGSTSAFIATYLPTKEWIDARKGHQIINFKGEIKFTPVNLQTFNLSQALSLDKQQFSTGKTMSVGGAKSLVYHYCDTYVVYMWGPVPCSSGVHTLDNEAEVGRCDFWDDRSAGTPPGYGYSNHSFTDCYDLDIPTGGGTSGSTGGGSSPNPPGDYDPCDVCGTPSVSNTLVSGGIAKLSVLPPNCCDEDNGGLYPLPPTPINTIIQNLINNLPLSNFDDQYYLASNANLAIEINNYLNANGWTLQHKDFVIWAVSYLNENRNLLFSNILNELNKAAIVTDPANEIWTDPDNIMLIDLDQTIYQQYQDNIIWPTVSKLIPKSDFVSNRYVINSNPRRVENCFVLAKEQLGKKGYTVSGYDISSPQLFQVYTSQVGVDIIRTREAISYMNKALQNGIPVLVGVDVRNGAPAANLDNTTDHYIVIMGSGTDSKGKYYQFYDSSTNYDWLGASDSNKLYFDSTTGKITGKTSSQYGSYPSHHDFIITQVRKSIKK
jgi:hypothetical protein